MDDLRERQTTDPDVADAEPPDLPLATPAAMASRATSRSKRRHLGSRPFRVAASILVGGAALVEGVKIASEHWPADRRTPNSIAVGNPYSEQHRAEKMLDARRGNANTRDPQGKIVLFPGVLITLYWPPGQAKKDQLTLEDLKKLAVHLNSVVKDLRPNTVLFDAVICTPDPESQRRIEERNRQMLLRPRVMSPAHVRFNRQMVPITVGALRDPPPKKAACLREAAIVCIVNTCHRRPPGNPPGMVGHGIRESVKYDPTIPYGIGFGDLPTAPDEPAHPGAQGIRMNMWATWGQEMPTMVPIRARMKADSSQ
jgi:hypothetical protein